jgi:hypothetical protein
MKLRILKVMALVVIVGSVCADDAENKAVEAIKKRVPAILVR